MSQATSHVLDAIEDIREGRIVVVVDYDDRENEGDLIVAAAKAMPEQVAFINCMESEITWIIITNKNTFDK